MDFMMHHQHLILLHYFSLFLLSLLAASQAHISLHQLFILYFAKYVLLLLHLFNAPRDHNLVLLITNAVKSPFLEKWA
jgi:hypothetical protein